MNASKVLITAALFHLALMETAHAMSVSPMSANFDLFGSQTSVVYTVSNPDDKPIAVEVTIEKRTTTPDGKEVNESSPEIQKMFSIFPAATIIPSKQKKGIRIIYVGPKDMTGEKTYRINITETPAKADGSEKNTVRMLRKFRTTAYIHPKGSKPDLKVVSVEANSEKISVFIQNQGTAHQLIQKMTLKLKDETGATAQVSEKTNEALVTNVLSGEDRKFEFRRPAGMKGKSITATIESLE